VLTGHSARRNGWITLLWTLLAALAVLWPSRAIGPLDGVPLDARAEAILIGLVLPWLWWFDRRAMATTASRILIVSLLVWKLASTALLAQQGLCAASFAKGPLHGINQGIPIDESSGALRSWDLRADLLAPTPDCTAILTRPLPTQADFPAWFLNLTDSMLATRDFTMAVRGYVTTSQSHTLTIDAEPGMRLTGRIDQQPVSGAPMALGPGTHEIDLSLSLGNGEWRLSPQLDGRPLWAEALVTTREPSAIDRLAGSWAWVISLVLAGALIASMSRGLIRRLAGNALLAAWTIGSAAAAAALALSSNTSWHRAAGVLTLAAVAIPARSTLRNLHGAWLLIGIPWLAFFAVWSLHNVGRFSIYLPLDDWLTFQVASHRIYMQGYWLEGGNAVFSFQPLYRWMTGALHLIFGDSSVGEVYWDATCMLVGALLAFQIVRTSAGFRWAMVAAATVLATYTLSPTWYFVGRGLSEITAAGWAFLAMFFLLRGRKGSPLWIASAGVFAVLMFYTRLNHLLFAPFLAALLLSLRVPMAMKPLVAGLRGVSPRAVILFGGVFAIGVFLFALRTWHYTGVFSVFYGTSLPNHDIGLRPWTILNREVWAAIAHSLASLFWMTEPVRADPRAIVVAAGALVGFAALLQVPIVRNVPAALVIVAAGATVGSFLVHVHAYPGRISVHLVPLMSALTFIALARALDVIIGRSPA
jgi:hypothetical protein